MPKVLAVAVATAILLGVSGLPAVSQDGQVNSLGLPSPTDQTPDQTPDVGPLEPDQPSTTEGMPALAPGLRPQRMVTPPAQTPEYDPTIRPNGFCSQNPDIFPRPVRTRPVLRVAADEVGIYNPSQLTLTFLIGDPATKVKLDPSQIKVVTAVAGGQVQAQIQTGSSSMSEFTLSAGTVYALEFSGGAWVFNKY